jgi:hypothetical protein
MKSGENNLFLFPKHLITKTRNKMRNIYFALTIALMIFVGCKPRTASSTLELKTSDTSKMSGKGLNMPDVGNLATNGKTNSTSGTGSWSKDYRNKFLQGCISKAAEKVSAADAFNYCSCMTDKVEAKYPVESEVDSKLTDADVASMKPDCLANSGSGNSNTQSQSNNNNYNNSNSSTSQSWSASDQQEFMDNCVPGASKSLGSGASGYCSCMMNKLMAEYPNSKDIGNVSKQHMTDLAKDCIRR